MSAKEVKGFPTPDFDGGCYTAFEEPQCTWYCYGRAREIAGKTIRFSRNWGLNGENWWDCVTNCDQSSTPKVNSIAVWQKGPSGVGHVAFVYGQQGYNIIFSDSNFTRDNKKTYSMEREEFEDMCYEGNFLGYLVL